jgi:hypothetical protein
MSSASRSIVCKTLSAAAVAVGCAACSTPTTISKEWENPSYTAGPMKNVLVCGVRLGASERRTLEDAFASALSMHGTRATPSYSLFPAGLPDKEQARAVAKKGGFDGVLVSVLRGINETQFFDVTVGWNGGLFDDYWGPAWAAPMPPIETDETVKFETTLWDPHDRGKLVWSGVTKTWNPSSGRDFASSLVSTIVPALVKDRLIPAGTVPQVSLVHARP